VPPTAGTAIGAPRADVRFPGKPAPIIPPAATPPCGSFPALAPGQALGPGERRRLAPWFQAGSLATQPTFPLTILVFVPINILNYIFKMKNYLVAPRDMRRPLTTGRRPEIFRHVNCSLIFSQDTVCL
jgi:hypothetical protein